MLFIEYFKNVWKQMTRMYFPRLLTTVLLLGSGKVVHLELDVVGRDLDTSSLCLSHMFRPACDVSTIGYLSTVSS